MPLPRQRQNLCLSPNLNPCVINTTQDQPNAKYEIWISIYQWSIRISSIFGKDWIHGRQFQNVTRKIYAFSFPTPNLNLLSSASKIMLAGKPNMTLQFGSALLHKNLIYFWKDWMTVSKFVQSLPLLILKFQ